MTPDPATKGFTMFKRKPRSPLSGASKKATAMLREIAERACAWERTIPLHAVSTPSTYDSDILDSTGYMSWYSGRNSIALSRAMDRLGRRKDFKQIQRNRQLARLREDNPAVYEVRMLRNELKAGLVTPESLDRSLGQVEQKLCS